VRTGGADKQPIHSARKPDHFVEVPIHPPGYRRKEITEGNARRQAGGPAGLVHAQMPDIPGDGRGEEIAHIPLAQNLDWEKSQQGQIAVAPYLLSGIEAQFACALDPVGGAKSGVKVNVDDMPNPVIKVRLFDQARRCGYGFHFG
jgi:hypothetical protein